MVESLQPDVPILVETPARPFFSMVRCHYLSIEYDTPQAGWGISFGGVRMPFLMLGLTGIVRQPFGADRFNDYGLIDGFFQEIEARTELSLNFEDIWMPAFLFGGSPQVGDVYRVGLKLFVLAFQYRDTRFSQEEFEAHCNELRREISFSADETAAFKGWTAEQIAMAQSREPKDPKLQLRTITEL